MKTGALMNRLEYWGWNVYLGGKIMPAACKCVEYLYPECNADFEWMATVNKGQSRKPVAHLFVEEDERGHMIKLLIFYNPIIFSIQDKAKEVKNLKPQDD